MVLSGAVGAVALAGCGGSSHTSSTKAVTSAPTTATTTAPTTPPAGIAGRLLTAGEAGFIAPTTTTVDHTAQGWVTDTGTPSGGGRPQEVARLRRLGFIAGATENITSSDGAGGLSFVEQFSTPGAARAELANEIRSSKAGFSSYKQFPVPGIPGAIGFGGSGNGSSGINVAFTDGDYYYLVGQGVTALGPEPEHALIAAAQSLYHRVQR